MPTPTYTLIQEIIPGSAGDINLNSIPQIYNHLCLETYLVQSNSDALLYPNGDSGGTLWSFTNLVGDGTSATSNRTINYAALTVPAYSSYARTDFFNYTNTSIYKTVLQRGNWSGITNVKLTVGMYRSPSAITSIRLSTWGGNGFVGSYIRLWGII